MIRRLSRAALVAMSLCAFALASHAQTKPKMKIPPENQGQAKAIIAELLKTNRIIRSSSVKRGMKGYALSVFQGTKIEKFPIVVLGNLERVQGGGDIVLIKVLGGPVVERQSGIVAGMSGSPVYINGKMLGAIALGWGFPKEPIGGVTPITEMIETSLPDPARAKPQPAATKTQATTLKNEIAYKPSTPITLAGHKIARVEVSRDKTRLALSGPQDGATMTMRPVNTLLQVSGFSEKSLERLKTVLEPYQISPVIGPSSKKTVPPPPILPGSAMGVQLVSGDMDQTAIGTVTFRWGNRILGFGHPMFGQGSSSLPLTSAYVHEIFPSYQRSFKLASPIAPAGAVQQDTQFAVGGTLHIKADTVPMSIAIVEAARNINRTYRVQVMKDPILTPQLITMVAAEAIETKLGITSDKMVRIKLKMDLENQPSIIRSNVLYAGDAVTRAALVDLSQSLMISQMNEFSRGSIKRVDLKVEVVDGRKTAIIKAMTANKNKIKAGETVTVNVVLEPTNAPNKPVTRAFTFQVPTDAPTGVLRLAAAASVNFWPLQARVGGAPPDPTNLRELLNAWNKVGAFNELMVQASTSQIYLQVGDQKVSDPAPAWASLMRGARSTNVGAFNEVEVRRANTPFVLDGAQFLSIPIESADGDTQTTATENQTDADDVSAVPGEKQTPVLPAINDDKNDGNDDKQSGDDRDDNDNSENETQSAFAAPPHNGRWGELPTEKAWNELFAAPALLKQFAHSPRGEDAQVPPKNTGEKPVTPTAPGTPPAAAPKTPAVPKVPTPKPAPTPPAFGAGKSVARPARSWTQTGVAEFLKGKFENAFVTNQGEVQAAPGAKQIAQVNEPFVWSIAGDNSGNVFLGTGLSTGNKARILKVDANGKQSTFWEGDGVAITALTSDNAGNLYAAVAPGGRVLKFASGNKTSQVFDTKQTFVWALHTDAQNNLLIATGGERGVLLRAGSVDFKKSAELFTTPKIYSSTLEITSVPQKHIRSLATRGDEIFFGTGQDGVLYRFNEKTKKLDALFQAGDAKTSVNAEILAIAAAPEGIYFGTSLNGTIYRWSEKEGVETLYPAPQKSVFALQRTPDGSLYAATGDNGTVYQIRPGPTTADTRVARVLEPDQRQALSLAQTGSTLLIGTGNGGAAYQLNLKNAGGGTYTSPVFDAQSSVRWGMLRFIGTGATIETRSGNTAEPDATWSDWQNVNANELGELSVASPPARYLQYRVLVQSPTSDLPSDMPKVSRVEVVYRSENSAPEVNIGLPAGGAFWMGKKKITWNGKDADSDALQYHVAVSDDGGQAWQEISDENLKTLSMDWDTSKVADGTYRVRVIADDSLANAEDAKTGKATSLPFTVDNTAPVVQAGLVKDGENWRLIGSATDATSPISGAEWRFIPKEDAKPEGEAGSTPDATAENSKNENSTSENSTNTNTANTPAPKTTAAVTTTDATSSTAAKTEVAKSAIAAIAAIVAKTNAKPKAKSEIWRAVGVADGIFDSRREAFSALISSALLPKPDAADEAGSTPGDESKSNEAETAEPSAGATKEQTETPIVYQLELRVFDAAGNSATMTLDLP
jgi:hypothetical protein